MTRDAPPHRPSLPDITEMDWDTVEKGEVIDYDSETGTYRVSFTSDGDAVCRAVIMAVAAVAETKPLELPPLYSAIDPDALAALVTSAGTGAQNTDIHVTFTFHGYTVSVRSYGIIAVQPPRGDQNVAEEDRTNG